MNKKPNSKAKTLAEGQREADPNHNGRPTRDGSGGTPRAGKPNASRGETTRGNTNATGGESNSTRRNADGDVNTDYHNIKEEAPTAKAHWLSFVDDITGLLNYFMFAPLADIGRAWKFFTRSGDKTSAIDAAESPGGYYDDVTDASPKKSVPWYLKIVLFPFAIVLALISVIVKLVISPLELIRGITAAASTVSRTSLVVSTIMSILLGVAVWFAIDYKMYLDGIRNQRLQMANAYLDKDFEQTITLYRDLAKSKIRFDDEERFRYALSLLATEQGIESRRMIDRLAPAEVRGSGFPPAHRLKAVSIAATMRRPVEEKTLRSLKWHLDSASTPNDPDHHFAWAQYYMAVQENITALTHLESASQTRPELNLVIAAIYQNLNRPAEYKDRLERARQHYAKQLESKPDDAAARITLSQIRFNQENPEDAEKIILAGPAADPKLRAARAEHFLTRYVNLTRGNPKYEKIEKVKNTTEGRFNLIKRALRQDLNHLATYHHLIRFYQDTRDGEEKKAAEEVMTTLQETIRQDDDAGLAYFALSNILWSQKQFEDSRKYMEEAFQRSPKELVVVANNLAWILAEAKPPELERAYELSNRAVQARPEDGRIRDTLAHILHKQEKFREALVQYKRALPTVSNQPKTHEVISEIYEKLGEPDLAERHLQMAKQTQPGQ